jgi:hypothetical protein
VKKALINCLSFLTLFLYSNTQVIKVKDDNTNTNSSKGYWKKTTAEEDIINLFEKKDIVALGLSHSQQDEADFVLRLVQNSSFPQAVHNIVIETGNALYQDILDKYIAGKNISFDQIKQVWQNTTQPGRGDDPQHRRLLEAIRDINKKLSPKQKIRVLAGDPPIDWAKIKTANDVLPFTQRDPFFASVVLNQVLEKKEKALLLIGSGHVMRKPMSYEGFPADSTYLTITNIIEAKYPGSAYVIIAHEDFGSRTDELEPKLSSLAVPALIDLKNHWIGDLDASLPYTGKILRIGMDPQHPAKAYPGLKLKDLADGYLYLGPIASIKWVQWKPEEGTAYAKEIARRDSLVIKATMPDAPASGAIRVIPHK